MTGHRFRVAARPLFGLFLIFLPPVYGADAANADSACPAFEPHPLSAPLTKGDKAATFVGGIVAWVQALSIDTDGAATAYHPDNIGTSHLCDGLDPYVDGRCLSGKSGDELSKCAAAVSAAKLVGWDRSASPAFCVYGIEARTTQKDERSEKPLWGGSYGNGPLPRQRKEAGDPAPGFFISTTSSPLPVARGASRVTAYADADHIPYVVVPRAVAGQSRPTHMKAAGMVVRIRDQYGVPAIVAETGEAFGEISVAAAQLLAGPQVKEPTPITEEQLRNGLNLPYPYAVSKASGRPRPIAMRPDGPYLVFAFSAENGTAKAYSWNEAKNLSSVVLAKYRSEKALVSCALQFFTRP